MIVVEPLGGLCNRMRALDSALSLARKTDQSLVVTWYKDEHLHCDFDDLFLRPRHISMLTSLDSSRRRVRRLKRVWAYASFLHTHIDQDRVEALVREGFDFERLPHFRINSISTWSRFHRTEPLFGDFVPIQRLQRMIDLRTRDFDNVVGVHVRRGDNTESIENSPTARFIEAMEQELKQSRDARFFLATDSPVEQRTLTSHFPGKILIHEKASLDRNKPEGVQDALIDLFCLASCRKVIGSFWSSFTDTACELRGIEKVVVKS